MAISLISQQDLSCNGALVVAGIATLKTTTNISGGLVVTGTSNFVGTVSGAGLTKTSVGLANVDNTTDALKPVSTAGQTALNLKSNLASPTFTGTVNTAEITTSNNNINMGSGSLTFSGTGGTLGVLNVKNGMTVDNNSTSTFNNQVTFNNTINVGANNITFSGGGTIGVFTIKNGMTVDDNYYSTFNNASFFNNYTTTVVSITTTSDKRLKENITPITNGLNIIRQLQPSSYILTPTRKQDVGLIAQDVLNTDISFAVTNNLSKDLLGINYNVVMINGIQAIKELDNIVETVISVAEAQAIIITDLSNNLLTANNTIASILARIVILENTNNKI